MDITASMIRGFRLQAHRLDGKAPMSDVVPAAGACGLQNSPPGAWETSLFNRLDRCTLHALHEKLYGTKELLQAWSYRGAPVVFPTAESDVFLTSLIARAGESPWIYTRGITGSLDHLGMAFDELLLLIEDAARHLDGHTVKSKEALDRTLAGIIGEGLPSNEKRLWEDPSIYDDPEKQTMGQAAVSFLLRPCSFKSLVVFGEREGASPTFTSYRNWTGKAPQATPDAEREIARRFLHCYGPTTVDCFMAWLGCSKAQAKRLWDGVADETVVVQVDGKARTLLSEDAETLRAAEAAESRLILLGAHDPYLDIRDRAIILEDEALHKAVWKYVANPGAILKGGRIIGTWKAKVAKGHLNVSLQLWERTSKAESAELERLAGEYAAFRLLGLGSYTVDPS